MYVFNVLCTFSWNKKRVIDCKNAQCGKLQKYICYVHSVCIMAKLNIIHHSTFHYVVCR